MTNQERSHSLHTLSVDAFLHLLSDRRRRFALSVLAAHDRRMTVNDLTKAIVTHESSAEITEVPGDEVVDVYISLYHNHLPRLSETPLIEYDSERGLVAPTAVLAQVEPFVSLVAEADSVHDLFVGT